jgi:DNA-binding GntR family transcriptional regulator
MPPESITQVIGERLANGTYGHGTVLPALRVLSLEFGVSEWAVRKALRPLRDTGNLRSIPGRGNIAVDRQATGPVGCGSRKIEQIIRARIADSTYAVRTWLPSARALAAEFGVSTITVRGAQTPLKREKLLASVPTLGTYVVDPHQPGVPPPGRASHDAARIGKALRERLRDGTYPPGSRLPTNAELSAEFEVRPNMISKALKPIRSEGLVFSGLNRRFYAARPTTEPPGLASNATRVLDGDLKGGLDHA